MVISEYILDSKIGNLHLTASRHALIEVAFVETAAAELADSNAYVIIQKTVHQLKEYFEGNRSVFELPLAPEGTAFQRRVWKALQNIPYGTTLSYAGLSDKVGDPLANRAVGRANGQNPIPIIIPCHRVVGADNKLVGYSGGIEKKRWLLQHEGVLLL